MSEYKSIYDVVVDKGHFLRKVKEEIDFSFVNELLKSSYCENFGRPAKEPEMIFKILFLKKLYDFSDEVLVEQIKVNMAYKYFLDMLPEDEPVDSSLLTKFRKTRITQDMLEDMLKETIRQAIEKKLIKSTAIIVDATHSLARFKHQSPTEILRKLTKELRYQIYNTDYDLSAVFPDKPIMTAELDEEISYTRKLIEAVRTGVTKSYNKKAKELFSKIEKMLKDEKIREMQSACDEEARTGHKSADDRFFGFKNHIAMTEERLITGLKITDGSVHDGKHLSDLVEQSRENGIAVTEVIGDTAYCTKDNLEAASDKEAGFDLVSKLHPCVADAHTKERDGFTFNKDADTYACQAGHIATVAKYHSKKNNNIVLTYRFSKVKCKKCPLQNQCKISKKSRAFSVTIPKELFSERLKIQETEHFKTRYRQRYKIEAKNAEAKCYHGLGEADSKGIQAMNIQSYFTAVVLNIKRILKLQTLKTETRG